MWQFFSLLLIMFYVSNLRAHLLRPSRESPIDTLEDIISNNKRVFIYEAAIRHLWVLK